jgi:hypothetical protein
MVAGWQLMHMDPKKNMAGLSNKKKGRAHPGHELASNHGGLNISWRFKSG